MDREKVIKELESLRDICNAKSNMATGKGKIAWAGYANSAEDALALLKEQENGKWIDHTFAHGNDIECPFCHKKWNVIDNCTETFDYCPGCGAKLS